MERRHLSMYFSTLYTGISNDMSGVGFMLSGSISFAKVTLFFKTCKKRKEKFGYMMKKHYFCISIQKAQEQYILFSNKWI